MKLNPQQAVLKAGILASVVMMMEYRSAIAQPPPVTEMQLRATIAEHNTRTAQGTRQLVRELRTGPLSVQLGRTDRVVERFFATPIVNEGMPDVELEAARGLVAVLGANRSPQGNAMLQLSPVEAEWSAALFIAGAIALGRTGQTDDRLIDTLVRVALGSATRNDLLTRLALTGGRGIEGAEKLRFQDPDILDRIRDVLDGHAITRALDADCARELKAGAMGLVGSVASVASPRIPSLSLPISITPNHGRPGSTVVLRGSGWPAVKPDDVAVAFRSNTGKLVLATVIAPGDSIVLEGVPQPAAWSTTEITVRVPSGVGVGPVGFVSHHPDTGQDAAGRSIASAMDRCLGARGAQIASRFAAWHAPVPLTVYPGLQPGNTNLFTGGPQIRAIAPVDIMEEGTINVTGHEFAPGDRIAFEGVPQPTTFVSDGHLTAALPAIASRGPQQSVYVTTPTEDSSNSLSVRVLLGLTGLSQPQARVGDTIEIVGSGFGSDTTFSRRGFALPGVPGTPINAVVINSKNAKFTVQSSTTVPEAGETFYISASNSDPRFAGFLSLHVFPPPPPPLYGWVDLHTHPMVHLAFGGHLVHGGTDIGSVLPKPTLCRSPIEATSIAEALNADGATYGLDLALCTDLVRQKIIEGFQKGNNAEVTPVNARGYPDFSHWPKWNEITHQKMWVDWIRRAKNGGLRVLVALAVNNRTLGDVLRGHLNSPIPTDDKGSADFQLAEMKEFVARHSDFMELANDAASVARIVRANKLAVVLGVEIDMIGNFGATSPLAKLEGDEARDVISAEIQRLYDEGVRYIFPVHVLDNLFGGTAIYENGFNRSNFRETGKFWRIECADASDGITHKYEEESDFLVDLIAFGRLAGFDSSRRSGPGPECVIDKAFTGHRNEKPLTDKGNIAITEMMKRGMIIDIDHMSQKTAEDTFALAELYSYPVVSGHNGIRGSLGQRSENARTPSQLRRISQLGGMFGLGTARVLARDWGVQYDRAINLMGPTYRNGAVALGTDLNGFVPGPRPSGGGLQYSTGFPQSSTGTKTWDYNTDGVAHYGMLHDFIVHLRGESYPHSFQRVENHLFRSADYFWQMWQRIESRRSSIP